MPEKSTIELIFCTTDSRKGHNTIEHISGITIGYTEFKKINQIEHKKFCDVPYLPT